MIEFSQLVEALKCYLCVPTGATCELSEWLNSPKLSFYGEEDSDYKRAVKTVQRSFCHYNYKEILELMGSTSRLVWYARSPDHYFTRDQSLEWCLSLLEFQYGEGGIRDFLIRLVDITEKRVPKKNTMFISGQSNCGKSWFFDMVVAFYVNVGHVANFVRGNNFPLNDCINRRILYWNEPSIMPSGYETLKMLAGGDPLPTAKKYADGATISRTPLIMTSNSNRVFPSGSTWDSRVYRENWRPYEKLKGAHKYPSPWAFPLLLKKYDCEPK